MGLRSSGIALDHPRGQFGLALKLDSLCWSLGQKHHHLQSLQPLVRRRLWLRILQAVMAEGVLITPPRSIAPTSRHTAPPTAEKGGQGAGHRPFARWPDTKLHALADLFGLSRLIADKGYDADRLRNRLKAGGTRPVIPGRRSRERPVRYDVQRYRECWRIEAAFCRLKDFHRVATRYDKLAANFLSAVALADHRVLDLI